MLKIPVYFYDYCVYFSPKKMKVPRGINCQFCSVDGVRGDTPGPDPGSGKTDPDF